MKIEKISRSGGSLMDSVPSVDAVALEDDTSAFGQLLSNRDLVFFTQRGTSYADPAPMCGLDYFDDYIDLTLEGSTIEEREASELAAIQTRSDTYKYAEMCDYFGLPLLPDVTDEPISSDLPVLILSGAYAPITPPLTADPISETLDNSCAFTFPYGGHVQLLASNRCAKSMVLPFLADPTTEPDSSCIAEMPPLEFALPAE